LKAGFYFLIWFRESLLYKLKQLS